jgi:hypothetical protein
VYTFISGVEILHIIGKKGGWTNLISLPPTGTYEKVEDEEEEVYETVCARHSVVV